MNTKNFEIQKRTDVSDFKTIGVVKSKNISGVHQYAFADDNLTSGTSYYRLNQVDNDGKSSFSDIVTVNVKSAVSLSVYPNPVENFLSLTHPVTSNKAFAKIINLEGKTYTTDGFDHGYPPVEIENFINKLVLLTIKE